MAILLTGLTGVVGSVLAPVIQLQSKEKIFCLVRNGKARVMQGKLHKIPANQIIDADITKSFCGLSAIDVWFLKNQKITKVVHSGGLVKFDKELHQEIWTTNFTGTKNILSVAKELGVKEFHFISTAYVSTKRNPYENSKAAAEELVKNSGIKCSIYRLGIVIGDSENSHINFFNGYYGFFAGLHRIAERQREKIGMNGNINLHLYVNCSFNSTLNIVPIDWVVETLSGLMATSCNGIFHITHPNPPLVHWVMKNGFNTLGITGIQYNDYGNQQPMQANRAQRTIQKAVNRELFRYLPYVTEEASFSLKETKEALREKFKNPPEITPKLLAMLLDFAARNNFGQQKKSSKMKIIGL